MKNPLSSLLPVLTTAFLATQAVASAPCHSGGHKAVEAKAEKSAPKPAASESAKSGKHSGTAQSPRSEEVQVNESTTSKPKEAVIEPTDALDTTKVKTDI